MAGQTVVPTLRDLAMRKIVNIVTVKRENLTKHKIILDAALLELERAKMPDNNNARVQKIVMYEIQRNLIETKQVMPWEWLPRIFKEELEDLIMDDAIMRMVRRYKYDDVVDDDIDGEEGVDYVDDSVGEEHVDDDGDGDDNPALVIVLVKCANYMKQRKIMGDMLQNSQMRGCKLLRSIECEKNCNGRDTEEF